MAIKQQLNEKLDSGLQSLGLDFSDAQRLALLRYLELLGKWNTTYNLSGISDPGEMLTRHLLDSLAIAQYFGEQHIVDVGSGAGLPGIPLAIAWPGARVVLMDSNGKKTRFLFQAALQLGLSNVQVENCRVEHYQSTRQIDIVTCRAFSSLAEILTSARHLFEEGSKLLAMKGHLLEQELAGIPDDFRLDFVQPLQVPGLEESRNLVAVTCISAVKAERQ